MGGGKESSTRITQTTPRATPEERRLNRLEIERVKAVQPLQIEAQKQGLNLVNMLLTGTQPLPGFFGELGGGISPDVTRGIVGQTLEDIRPGLQQSGLIDSGVRASLEAQTGGDIRRAVEEFNIGNKFNLLNLALSGQAQVQQPLLAQSAMLGQRLAGLRPVTTTQSQTIDRGNPFLNSFQQSLGQTMGSFGFSRGPFSFGR